MTQGDTQKNRNLYAERVLCLAGQIAFNAKDVHFLAEEGDRDAATAKHIRQLAAEMVDTATALQGLLEEIEAEADAEAVDAAAELRRARVEEGQQILRHSGATVTRNDTHARQQAEEVQTLAERIAALTARQRAILEAAVQLAVDVTNDEMKEVKQIAAKENQY